MPGSKREKARRRQQERWIKRDEDRVQGATTPRIETYPTLPRSPRVQQGLDVALALAQKSRGRGARRCVARLPGNRHSGVGMSLMCLRTCTHRIRDVAV
ncbi:uncharacterized [Tachysurus ichikawai]